MLERLLAKLHVHGRGYHLVTAITGVFSARLIAAAAAAGSTFVVARDLSPEIFAHFMFLFMLMNLVENLIGPSLDASLVRFASSHISEEKDDSPPYFRAVFWVKLTAAGITVVLGIVSAPLIHHLFLTGPAGATIPNSAVTVAFVGGAVVMLWRYAQSYFQAHQRFKDYARIELASSVLRLGFAVGLWLVGAESVLLYLSAYVLAPGLVGIATWARLPKDLLSAKHKRPGIMTEFWLFAGWMVVTALFSTLANRIDGFLLPWFEVPEADRGFYFAALVLVNLGELVVLTMFHVLLPHASQLRTVEERRRFLKKSFWPCVLISLAMLCCLPLSGVLVALTYGEAYRPTGTLFAILFIGILFRLITVPSATLVMALGRSRILALLEAIKFLALIVLGCLALSVADAPHAALSMAWTMSLVKGTMAMLTYVIAHRIVLTESVHDTPVSEPATEGKG